MTLAPKTFGAEVGDGMSLLANNWVSTQNTLEQQRLKQQQDEADYNFKLRQQQANETYQQGQLTQGQGQLDLTRLGLEQQAARDAASLAQTGAAKRVTDFTTVRSDFDGERSGLVAAMTAARTAGDQSAFQHAKDRLDQLTKLMKSVNLSTQDDAAYWPARQALYEFIGGPTPQPAGAQPAVPVPMDMNFPPARTTVARGDAVANGDPAPIGPPSPATPPAAAPVTSDAARYTDIRQIPIGELVQMDPNALEQQFPGIGSSWWGTHKQSYDAAVAKQSADAADARLANWKAQYAELSKNPDLTPSQRTAMLNISTLLNLPSLDANQQKNLTDSMAILDPAIYTPSHWQTIVSRNNDAEVVAEYDFFAQKNPDVVKGFNIDPYRARLTAAVEKDAAGTAYTQAQTIESGARTDTDDALRPGKVDAQTDAHDESVLTQEGTAASTDLTRANAGKARGDTAATRATTQRNDREAGIKNLTETFATLDPKLSYYQIGLQMPGLLASTKAALGLTDAGMNNLIREAQFKYGQGIRTTDLAIQLAGSKVLTENATRAGVIASTADTISTTRAREARLQPELNLLNQQIRNAELQGQDTASLIARRNALLPYDVQQAQANVSSTQASTQKTLTLLPIEAARGWADIGNIQSQVHARNVQTNLDMQAQKGKLDLTQATIAHLGAQTLYERTRTPGDPLYNPAVAATKPGDPQAALYKQIDQYVKASKTASGLVGTLQNQINAISKKYTTALGTVDLSRITPEDKASLATLTSQRDHQVAVATNRQRAADDLLLKNPPAGPAVPTQPQKISMGLPAAQTWASQHPEVPGVASDCAAIAGQYLNDLGLKIAPSNASAGLEANAKKGGWKPTPIAGIQRGDLVVWTGAKYGLQKVGGVGKHVGVVADVVNGVPQILMNPGLLPDGTQGTTKIVPMSDQGAATAYRAPSGTKAPPASATPPAVAKPAVTPGAPLPTTPAAPRPAAKPAVDTSMPAGITPVESVKPLTGKLKAAGWFASAAKVTTAEQASASLDQAVKIMNPSATPEQIQVMKRDLARTMGW